MFVFSGHMGFAGGLDTLELGLLGGTAMTHPHWHQGQDIFITEQLHLHWGMCQWHVSTCKWKNHMDLHKDRGYSTQEHEKEQWACLVPTCQPRFCSYPCFSYRTCSLASPLVTETPNAELSSQQEVISFYLATLRCYNSIDWLHPGVWDQVYHGCKC